ncbi:uncharacterized protein LOC118180390 [Stegodyphus dumicola]|uniref:uncharacterized protein LOC118180390 n=1 Tax=Stegodyphus dumicola TaxID=202533 RepID=UPI0015AD0226|nr:uncharacterized protein LOC118180390 [Stegodyphus dumicola]
MTFKDITLYSSSRRQVLRSLRTTFQSDRAAKLCSYPNQRKAIECAAASKASYHFFREGKFTRFADWRFIHRARLNLVPLNAARRQDNGMRGCRRCSFSLETLAHVVCHCMRYSRAFTSRHNTIVERIKKAASPRWTIDAENQTLSNLNLRPDLLLTKGRSAVVVDATVAFDNRLEAFHSARRLKKEKYAALLPLLRERFDDVKIEAVVVGALGTWDPGNDRFVRRICSKKYATLMRKLIISDTIRATRVIYIEHLTGLPQNATPNQE